MTGSNADPLADLRGREAELEEIAESDAPDAPVARMMLRLIRDDEIDAEDVAAIHPGGEADA